VISSCYYYNLIIYPGGSQQDPGGLENPASGIDLLASPQISACQPVQTANCFPNL
jgi:hypothetical protein